MVKKINLIIVSIILGVVLVSAGVIIYTNVNYPEKVEELRNDTTWTFDCGRVSTNVSFNSDEEIYDNKVKAITRTECPTAEITNIENENGDFWKENKYGFKSFEEAELRKHECEYDGLVYNSKTGECL